MTSELVWRKPRNTIVHAYIYHTRVTCLLSILTYLAIDLAVSFKGTDNSCWLNTTLHHHNATGIDYHWVILPEIFSGIGFGLGWLVSLEFTVAQSPGHMRGLMVGIYYGIAGATLLFSATLNFPFGYISDSLPLTCTFFYQMTKSILVLLVMLLFGILATNNIYGTCIINFVSAHIIHTIILYHITSNA